LTLAKGAVQTMNGNKLLQATLVCLTVGLLGLGIGFGAGLWPETRGDAPARKSESEPLRVKAPRPAEAAPAVELTLSSDRDECRPGESVNLTLAIKNNGEKDFSHLLYKITHLFDFAMTGPDGREVIPALNPIEFEYANTPVNVSPGKAVTITT